MKSWREECAVIGIWNHEEASRLAYLGLYAMQHRGQESSGIVSLDESGVHQIHKGLGLVGDVFQESELARLRGAAAIGHNRYSTTGQNLLANAQPMTANLLIGQLAIAHNGNIVNTAKLKQELQAQGSIFQGTSDSEIFLHLMARTAAQSSAQMTMSFGDTSAGAAPEQASERIIDGRMGERQPERRSERLEERATERLARILPEILQQIVGAYSLVFLLNDGIVAVRDPLGFRPLVLGMKANKEGQPAYVVASETCALDLIGAQYVREIEPGEIFCINHQGTFSIMLPKVERTARCVFEHVYFARPDSIVFGHSVYESRKQFGRWLARENPVEADVVIPVPDSGVPAALGYSLESGIPFEFGIIRNHYVGRTFIQPQQAIRAFGVKVKLNPQTAVLSGKRVIVVDDSLVRGTTSQKIIRMIRQAGAREVHMRIASPPTTGPCYYGVDTPQRSHLIAANQSREEICRIIEADSLQYLSIPGLFEAVKGSDTTYCAACFDGRYPTALPGSV